MNLAFVKDHNDVILNIWNIIDTSESLRGQGYCCDVQHSANVGTFLKYNAVIFYRSLQRSYTPLISALKRHGIACWVHDRRSAMGSELQVCLSPFLGSNLKEFFRVSDFFVFTSDYMAKYAPLGKPVFIRRPAILESRFEELSKIPASVAKEASNFKIVISKGHILPEFVSSIKQIFERCGSGSDIDVFYFSNIGKSYPSRIGRFVFHDIAYMEFDLYFKTLAGLKPSLILVPMPDDEFNKCKCYPKYLEAGTISSCILASSVYPYQKAITTENRVISPYPTSFLEAPGPGHLIIKNR